MKTTTFIFYFLFFGIIGYSQVETKIVTVDLSEPKENSIRICKDSSCKNEDNCKCESKWLSVKSKEMVAIKLINGNPFKYTYKIDTKSISFYNVEAKTNEATQEAAANSENKELVGSTLVEIQKIIDDNKSLNNDIDHLNVKAEISYETLRQKNVLEEIDLKNSDSLLEAAKKNYEKNCDLINDFKPYKDSVKYVMVHNSLIETKEKAKKSISSIIEKFFSVDLEIYTLPIDLQGKNIDALEFKLRRFDKETKVEDTDFASTPYNIWIKNGLKIDVSAGLFFSSLYDYEFDKRDDLSTSGNKIITLKNKGEYDLAFGSMINTYVRMNSWVVPTINFGAALTKNEKLQVLFGGGLILGKQERIIFTAGISMGKVERIADGYQVGGSYNLGDSGTIPTQSEFKFGKFFGITYNLSKVKKISLDKGIE